MPTPQNSADLGSDTGPDPSAVQRALGDIIESEEFAASPRLKQILTYIVEEKLAGRGNQIKGKTIAADVYGRELDGAAATDNIVRVEARRLRRLLDQYYEGTGQEAGLRIHIDPGGYVPRFEEVDPVASGSSGEEVPEIALEALQDTNGRVRAKTRTIGTAAVALAGVVALVAGIWLWGSGTVVRDSFRMENSAAMREALRMKSPTAVQSLNLSAQARGMLFPLFDPKRQKIAIGMFEHSIDLDADQPDGYAGKAQALATLAFLTSDETQSHKLLALARSFAETALEKGAASGRAHGGMAWVLGMSGDHGEARKHADIALNLLPDDGYILDIDGAIAILAGDGERAANASDPKRKRIGPGRFGAGNIWGVANFMLGKHQKVVAAFEAAPSAGAPVAAPSLIFLAVSQSHLGRPQEAKRLIAEMQSTWPNFPADFMIGRIFGSSGYASDILSRLEELGYQSQQDKGERSKKPS